MVTRLMADFTNAALTGSFFYQNATDLWGPSMCTMLYVRDATLRVTAKGYAVLMRQDQVQEAVADFTDRFSEVATLARYDAKGLFTNPFLAELFG